MKYIISFFILFFLSACQSKQTPLPVQEPQWINAPMKEGKIGAVGSAKVHFKGKTAQRKLAISRALDELAQQSGVSVKSAIVTQERRQGQQTKASVDLYSVQNTANETIKAHIQAVWVNPKTDEIFVWLLAD